MNKTQYIEPTLTVVKVELRPLLQASNPGYNPTSSFNDETVVGGRYGGFDEDEE